MEGKRGQATFSLPIFSGREKGTGYFFPSYIFMCTPINNKHGHPIEGEREDGGRPAKPYRVSERNKKAPALHI
jgi:hypothetical protein